MRRAVTLYRRHGLVPVVDGVLARVRSWRLRRRHGYGSGLVVFLSTKWLTGPHAQVGTNFRSGSRCWLETIDQHNGRQYHPRLTIGNNVSMNDEVHIACAHRVTIGNDVLMASKIFISDHNHGAYRGERQDAPGVPPGSRLLEYAAVEIGDRVWLGESVTVLPGTRIGPGSIIGANSVVSRDIPADCIAVGSPARVVKRFNAASQTWDAVH